MSDVKCPLVSLVSPVGYQARDLRQTQTSLAHSLCKALLVGLRSPALLVLLLVGELSFLILPKWRFRQAASRRADSGNSGTGNKPVGVSLELDWPHLTVWSLGF